MRDGPGSRGALAGARVLIVEDSFLLADELANYVRSAGGEVVGPFADAAGALTAVEQELPTAALLDVRLGEGMSYDLAAGLQARGVAVVFATGYDVRMIEAPFDAYPICLKPTDREQVLSALLEAIGA